MQKHLPSETALKVAHSVFTLSHTRGWSERLPAGLGQLTEDLVLAAELPRYTPRMMAISRRPFMARLYAMNDWLLPNMFEAFGYRKCQMNDWALTAIAEGIEQVVILGAGFDTLAMRLAPEHEAAQFFELDHPATAKAKHKAVNALGKPDNVHLVAVDLATTPLPEALEMSDAWRADAKSLFIAEGLFMYLTDGQIRDLLLKAAASSPQGSRFAFSHCLPSWAESARGRIGRGLVRVVGEPMMSWITSEDLPGALEGTGWAVISGVDDDARHGIERYALAELQPQQ